MTTASIELDLDAYLRRLDYRAAPRRVLLRAEPAVHGGAVTGRLSRAAPGGPLLPMAFDPGVAQAQFLWQYRLAPQRRLILIGDELTEDRGEQIGTRRVDDPEALRALLVDDIGPPAADVAELIGTLAARGQA